MKVYLNSLHSPQPTVQHPVCRICNPLPRQPEGGNTKALRFSTMQGRPITSHKITSRPGTQRIGSSVEFIRLIGLTMNLQSSSSLSRIDPLLNVYSFFLIGDNSLRT
jgi:hypothetical protein